MKLRSASLALTLGAVAPGAMAQALPGTPRESTVLPVLDHSSGRVEALLLLDTDPVPLTALDRLLANAPRVRGGLGARMTLDGGDSLDAALKLDAGPSLALLCDQGAGFAAGFGPLGEHCLLASIGEQHSTGGFAGPRLEAGWHDASLGLDLSFGLSWLESDGAAFAGSSPVASISPLSSGSPLSLATSQTTFGSLFTGSAIAPPELVGTRFASRGLGLRGVLDLGERSWVSLSGDISQNEWSEGRTVSLFPQRWDSSSLSVGLGYGSLSGAITGRLIELPGAEAWRGLDIGISWRTPWEGELTVGARNLLSTGDDPLATPLDVAKPSDESDARVPYVRYHQDL